MRVFDPRNGIGFLMEGIRRLQLQDNFLISTIQQQYTSGRILRSQGRQQERATVSGDYLLPDARLKRFFGHFHSLELAKPSRSSDPRFYIDVKHIWRRASIISVTFPDILPSLTSLFKIFWSVPYSPLHSSSG